MKVTQAYRFALDPSPVQERALRSHAGAARFAWNWGLARCRERYEAEGSWYSAIYLHKLCLFPFPPECQRDASARGRGGKGVWAGRPGRQSVSMAPRASESSTPQLISSSVRSAGDLS